VGLVPTVEHLSKKPFPYVFTLTQAEEKKMKKDKNKRKKTAIRIGSLALALIILGSVFSVWALSTRATATAGVGTVADDAIDVTGNDNAIMLEDSFAGRPGNVDGGDLFTIEVDTGHLASDYTATVYLTNAYELVDEGMRSLVLRFNDGEDNDNLNALDAHYLTLENSKLTFQLNNLGAGDIVNITVEGGSYQTHPFQDLETGPEFLIDIEPGSHPIDTVADVPSHYDTIQEAIDAADEGDTITVALDTYEENLVIEERISLVGLNKPVLEGSGIEEHGIYVNADNVEIKNFEVRNFGDRGVYAYSDGIVIDNVYSHNNENDGIRIRESKDVLIINSESSENDGDGISFYAYGEIINTNVHDNNERGIFHHGDTVDGQGHVTVKGCHILGNNFWNERAGGIILYGGSDGGNTLSVTVEDNTVEDNEGTGILVYKINHEESSDEPIDDQYESSVRDNEVSGTVENDHDDRGDGDGILVYLSHLVMIEDNEITDNEHAGVRVTSIYPSGVLEDTTGNEVNDNNIADHEYGILIQEGAEDTTYSDNTFENNDTDIEEDY